MTAHPARYIPILAPLVIAETIACHRDLLSFAAGAMGDYAIVRRDAKELHVWPA